MGSYGPCGHVEPSHAVAEVQGELQKLVCANHSLCIHDCDDTQVNLVEVIDRTGLREWFNIVLRR